MKYKGLKQQAHDIIKKMLLSGEIKPGERIREDLIADQISMSRTPVREAINQLIVEGFVKQIPRKGIFARKFTMQELVDIVEARTVLESYAARKCAIEASDGDLERISIIFDRLKEALRCGDMIEAGVLDGEFHKSIALYSKNRKIYSYIIDIEDVIVYARRMDVYNIRHKYTEENSITQHKEILEALISRNPDEAERLMGKNTREVLNRMVYEE
ncbi:GntR family transcriptional regulator [Gudongella sp. SC589]|uniref:GntR family transcriptional regulator n=1 Tax=Gudongella sp. SC589 TaxID=3385990 RepID=UPI0039049977